jgi:hypothetical protein
MEKGHVGDGGSSSLSRPCSIANAAISAVVVRRRLGNLQASREQEDLSGREAPLPYVVRTTVRTAG